MSGGVAPVIKHIPGHGRATVDSHLALPRIDTTLELLERTDFKPFKRLNQAPMAMTAHAVYTAADEAPVTTSPSALQSLIREAIGFDGLLMSDDLDMKALTGNSLESKTADALQAGCDIAQNVSVRAAHLGGGFGSTGKQDNTSLVWLRFMAANAIEAEDDQAEVLVRAPRLLQKRLFLSR